MTQTPRSRVAPVHLAPAHVAQGFSPAATGLKSCITERPVDPNPLHVAVIMDGNGRWAEARGLPRVAGHREGTRAVRAVVRGWNVRAAIR